MKKIIVGVAIILGVFFRVWQITKIPAGLAMDEAAFGYNAWSIATTGKDEFSKALPLAFRSFADFKLPAYGYATALVMKFFGPGVWQIRIVSVVSGLISCLFLFLIVRGLAGKRLAVLAALIMLWSPWGIIFSRGGFEANLGLVFFLAGVWGLVIARKKPGYLFLAITGLTLANYSYITYKFVGPVVLSIWLIAYRARHHFSRKVIMAGVIFALLNLPAYLMFLGVSGSNRISSLLDLNPQQTGYPAIAQLSANYLTFFSPRNLFFRPDPVRQRHFLSLATFYPWMFVFWLVGAWVIYKNRKTELTGWVIAGLLISPIPAAISKDPFATLRAIPMLPAYCVLLALGAEEMMGRIKMVSLVSVGLVIIMSMEMYSALMGMKYGQVPEWNGGMDKLAVKLAEYPGRKIFVDGIPDIYPNIALAMKINPAVMQAANKNFDLAKYYTDPIFPQVVSFDRFKVGKVDRSAAANIKGAILVARPEDVFENEARSRHWQELFTIVDAKGKPLFLGFALN